MIDAVNVAILVGASLIVLSTFTSLISQRIGAPLLLVFLGVGLLAGEDGLLGIEFNSGGSAYFVGSLALAIILFDSGFDTPLRSYRIAAAPALTLATFGVVLTATFVGLFAHLLFGLSLVDGLLLGSIIASTDAAAVFFLMRVGGLKLRDRVKATLEVESGANDPMAIFLTTVFVELSVTQNDPGFGFNFQFIAEFIQQIGLGLFIGVVGGLAIAAMLNRMRALDAGLFPIAGLAGALVIFSACGLLGGSGFLAAYAAGVVAGNRQIVYAHRLRRFHVGMTWLAQIGMFLTLGLLATPSEFGSVFIPALALAVILIVFARPLAVWLCLTPFGFKWREKMFVGWVGLRGAVSILLAILPGLGGVDNGDVFFNIIFIMVLSSLLIQGWTINISAQILNMISPQEPGLVDRVELELPGGGELELIGYRIHPESTIAKGERVPRWARPVLILRNGRPYTIHNASGLQAEDRAYLFSSPRQTTLLDDIYAKPHESSSAEQHGDFQLDGSTSLNAFLHQYGLPYFASDKALSIADYLARELGGEPVIGDRVNIGPIDIVVNALDDEGQASLVGLIIDPATKSRSAQARLIAGALKQFLRQLKGRFYTLFDRGKQDRAQ
ncbi:potassium/proton antiporter [Hyphococcus sp.]|uniref:potassium/proton antiporter n=1 Tax=Hyphococcus sp. TaxID=2038636 RepID=UPI003CCB7B4F